MQLAPTAMPSKPWKLTKHGMNRVATNRIYNCQCSGCWDSLTDLPPQNALLRSGVARLRDCPMFGSIARTKSGGWHSRDSKRLA